jgi:hypothetical protein
MMLHFLRWSNVSFDELRQADTEQFEFVSWLRRIGGDPDFRDAFLSRPVVSPRSSEDSQDNLGGGRHQRVLAARHRDENEDPDAPPRRRQRQA